MLFCIHICKYLQRIKSESDYERTNRVCTISIKTAKLKVLNWYVKKQESFLRSRSVVYLLYFKIDAFNTLKAAFLFYLFDL